MADTHPENIQLWSAGDGDTYADQPGTELSDDCPGIYGISSEDRFGCPDADGDGWSDEGDYYPSDSSRHSKSFLSMILTLTISILTVSVVAFMVIRRK